MNRNYVQTPAEPKTQLISCKFGCNPMSELVRDADCELEHVQIGCDANSV